MGGRGRLLQLIPLLFVVLSIGTNVNFADAFKVRCIERERQALLVFEQGLAYLNLSWGSGEECCAWEGIRCSNRTGRVVMLDLRKYYLLGTISSSLFELRHLTYLDLSYNHFYGSIPEFVGSLTNLQYLDLSNSEFTGRVPPQLGNLSNLHYLNLGNNSFSRISIDNIDWLSNLFLLEHLNLAGVDLSRASSWPTVTHNLPSLVQLHMVFCDLPDITTSQSFLSVNSSKSLAILELSDNNLTSSIFRWLFNFNSSLVDIDLQRNMIGAIPKSFRNLTNLRSLYLSQNILNDVSMLFQNLHGPIKNSLEVLSLSENHLSGSLPDLTAFLSLRKLHLDHNVINGTLTASIGQLSKLEILDASYNSLEGIISEAYFSNLSSLKYLDLSYNKVALEFSSDWVPTFQLDALRLSSCNLGAFPKWLHTQNNFYALDISAASILGTVPSWFWDLSPRLNELNLSYNHFHGMVPDLSMKFVGFSSIDLGSNNFSDPLPQVPQNASFLNLSNNKFSGSISTLCKFDAIEYRFLDLSNNLLSGTLPDCSMNFQKLYTLNLANNNFIGKIPTSFGFLWNIRMLSIRNNSVTGEFPSSLKNCRYLILLDLGNNRFSGKIPEWVGERLSNLRVLSLRSNEFNGTIPLSLCHLSNIQILDISINNILGTLPKCLNNFIVMAQKDSPRATIEYSSYVGDNIQEPYIIIIFSALLEWKGKESEYKNTLGLVKSLDLSSNKLSGPIPGEITSLEGMVSLNLSRNNLTGYIPPHIGQLRWLDSLDLSANQLVGEIPRSLAQISNLGVLNLSNNNLLGKIPLSTQLQSFNPSSYMGNPGLCGPPLTKVCPGDGPSPQNPTITTGGSDDVDSQEYDDTFITPGFYVCMALGFAFGFWGVCGTLVLNNSWRHAYFNSLNIIQDWLYVTTTVTMARFRRQLQKVQTE